MRFAAALAAVLALATAPATGQTSPPGRYQIVVVPGKSDDPAKAILLDTATGQNWILREGTDLKTFWFETLFWGAPESQGAHATLGNLPPLPGPLRDQETGEVVGAPLPPSDTGTGWSIRRVR